MSRHTTWAGGARNPGLLVLGVLLVLGGVAAAVWGPAIMAIAVLVAAALVITFSRLRVEIDRSDVRVKWGPVRWPVNRIPIETIRLVEAVAIRPMHAGGWGYRGSRVLFKQAAALVRGGGALKLHLDRGRTFVITVDDAPVAATILQDMIEQR